MKKNKIPKFKNEDQEREFWASHDSTDYIKWEEGENVTMPKLKPSMKSISLRLPGVMIDELKVIANKKDVPYQSLIKIFLSDRIEKEFHHTNA